MLTVDKHDRDKVGLDHVYPVMSRRSNGLSIGINLNPNNACNWRCVYCQVPNLIRAGAPPINLNKLESELSFFLEDVMFGDFYDREKVPDNLRVIRDISISGNGEATMSPDFGDVVDLVAVILNKYNLLNKVKTVLITNGSMVARKYIKDSLSNLKKINGEIWFKVDSVLPEGIIRINGIKSNKNSIIKRLRISSELCPTWIQTCFFAAKKGKHPDEVELSAYIDFLNLIAKLEVPIKGVYVYGIARAPMQNSSKLEKLPMSWFDSLQLKLKPYNLPFKISIIP